MNQLEITWNQRWRDRLSSWRPPGELIRTADYDVGLIARDTPAKAFVEEHHYSACYPSARERVGLFKQGELVGVAVFSTPCRSEVLTSVFQDEESSVELGRFVLLDVVPYNAETWFLSEAFRLLRKLGYTGVLSFSDPHPRTTLEGEEIFPGHVGTIYQAHNATYLGRTQRRSIKLLPDGRVLSARAISKIRAGERGWHGAARSLVAWGAPEPPPGLQDRRVWLREALAAFTRTIRHPGTHRYAWSLHRRVILPYGPYLQRPKKERAA